ncbi:MAG: OmpH family outer membrane protein [Bacteroidales bacterium]|nr:OmpH family outer membrane protein [Bacteroidales bacterium]
MENETPIQENPIQENPTIQEHASCNCPSCAPQPQQPKKKCNTNICLLALNLVMLVGLVVLYVLHFTGKGTPSKFNPAASEPVIAEDGVLKIAYVDSDTLLAKYQYAIDLQEQLNKYKETQEKSYAEQMTKFQNDYQNFIKTGENLTLSQQQAKESELKQRAERLSTLQEELASKVIEKQMNSNIELLNRIFAFVREYNAANQQFDIILRKTFTDSPSLYMNPGMDITDEIVEGLNKEYKEVIAKKK